MALALPQYFFSLAQHCYLPSLPLNPAILELQLYPNLSLLNKNLATDFGISTTGLLGTWTLQSDGNGDGYTANDTINLIVGAPPVASVPGPLPLFGAGAAFGWSRKLRRRIGSVSSSNSEG